MSKAKTKAINDGGELGRVVSWLERQPSIAKVTGGAILLGKRGHNKPAGTVEVKGRIPGANGWKATGYFATGKRDLYIYVKNGIQLSDLETMLASPNTEAGPMVSDEREAPIRVAPREARAEEPWEAAARRGDVYSRYIVVDPATAYRWLELIDRARERGLRQRLVNQRKVQEYAADMKAGRWNEMTPQGLIFHGDPFRDYAAASVQDGQHRLWAITEADKTLQMYATFNVPTSVMPVLDSGVKRTDADAARIDGIDSTTRHTALARALRPQNRNMSRSETLSTLALHLVRIDRVFQILLQRPQRGISNAVIAAVLVRASFYHDWPVIERFAKVLRGGMPEAPGDGSVLQLRNIILGMVGKKRMTEAELYLKTERAFALMVEGRNTTRLYESERELYPLPEEQLNEGNQPQARPDPGPGAPSIRTESARAN